MNDKLNSRVLVSEFYRYGMKKPIRKYAVYGGIYPPATMELNGNRYIMPGWYKLPDDEPTPELKDIAFFPWEANKPNIPNDINEINDELKAIYHSNDCFCIWVFETRENRNRFMDETIGMMKEEREDYFEANYQRD